MTKKELEAKVKDLEARVALLEFQREMDKTPPPFPDWPVSPQQPYYTGDPPPPFTTTWTWLSNNTSDRRPPGVYGDRGGNFPQVIVEA